MCLRNKTKKGNSENFNKKKVNLVEECEVKFLGSVTINALSKYDNNDHKWIERVEIVDTKRIVNFKIDSGAECNAISQNDIKGLEKDIFNDNTKLDSYNESEIETIGSIFLNVKIREEIYNLKFHVTKKSYVPILGLPDIENIGLAIRPNKVNNINEVTINKDNLFKNYANVFEGIGEIPNYEYEFSLKSNYVPKIDHPRGIPFKIRDQFLEELNKMEQTGIIRKVNEPTDFVSQVVIIKKPDNSLRICLDPQNLNECLKREHFKMPTFAEISSNMKNAKIFSTFDCKKTFYQVKLKHSSSLCTTFITPFGRFCFNRMPYGIKTATEIYHKKFKEIFSDIPNVEIYVDELIIWSENEDEHYKILNLVLERAKQNNIKFNREKCHIAVRTLSFLGHTFDKDGIKINSEKVEAIKKMSVPKDKKMLQRFLGMVTYVSKFIPNLSDLTLPLRMLVKKDAQFKWFKEQDTAYYKIIEIITKNTILSYYDPHIECVVSVDASCSGVGAVLLQNEKPIAFASKSFTESQKNWAQIEKEMNAIVYGCEKFHQYIAGKPFKVESDHKPLIPIFRKALNEIPIRLQKMRMRLQPYDIELIHKPGTELVIADMLSRNHSSETVDHKELTDMRILMIHAKEYMTDKRINQLAEETKKDKELQLLKRFIEEGWPNDKNLVPDCIRKYSSYKELLFIENDLVWKNHCIVIPQVLRKEILNKLHYNHMGMEKTKLRAREIIFWPGMTTQIEDKISNCETCLKFQKANEKETLISSEIPDGPWRSVGADLFYFQGQDYLLIIDYFSKYIEMQLLPDQSSLTTVNILKSMFARHGIPTQLRSDGGPQFDCKNMKDFAKLYDFDNIISSPGYPRSNGMVERHIQTLKNMLTKAAEDGRDPYLSLLEYRNMPVSNNLPSPSVMLMGRKLRGILPEVLINKPVNQHAKEELKKRQDRNKHYHDKNAKNLKEFEVGDRVRVQNGKKWIPAFITNKTNQPRQYEIIKEDGRKLKRN